MVRLTQLKSHPKTSLVVSHLVWCRCSVRVEVLFCCAVHGECFCCEGELPEDFGGDAPLEIVKFADAGVVCLEDIVYFLEFLCQRAVQVEQCLNTCIWLLMTWQRMPWVLGQCVLACGGQGQSRIWHVQSCSKHPWSLLLVCNFSLMY